MEKPNSLKSDRKQENLRINLGYLQLKLKYSEVSEYFSNYGVIKQLYIPQKPDERSIKNNALIQSYIVCEDKSTFSKILSKASHFIKGIKVDCVPSKEADYLETKKELEEKYKVLNEGKIHIQGVHKKTTEGALRKYFSQYGEIRYLRLLYNYDRSENKGFGFLQLDQLSAAQEVVNKKKHKINGSVYICTFYLKAKDEVGSKTGGSDENPTATASCQGSNEKETKPKQPERISKESATASEKEKGAKGRKKYYEDSEYVVKSPSCASKKQATIIDEAESSEFLSNRCSEHANETPKEDSQNHQIQAEKTESEVSIEEDVSRPVMEDKIRAGCESSIEPSQEKFYREEEQGIAMESSQVSPVEESEVSGKKETTSTCLETELSLEPPSPYQLRKNKSSRLAKEDFSGSELSASRGMCRNLFLSPQDSCPTDMVSAFDRNLGAIGSLRPKTRSRNVESQKDHFLNCWNSRSSCFDLDNIFLFYFGRHRCQKISKEVQDDIAVIRKLIADFFKQPLNRDESSWLPSSEKVRLSSLTMVDQKRYELDLCSPEMPRSFKKKGSEAWTLNRSGSRDDQIDGERSSFIKSCKDDIDL